MFRRAVCQVLFWIQKQEPIFLIFVQHLVWKLHILPHWFKIKGKDFLILCSLVRLNRPTFHELTRICYKWLIHFIDNIHRWFLFTVKFGQSINHVKGLKLCIQWFKELGRTMLAYAVEISFAPMWKMRLLIRYVWYKLLVLLR